MLLRKITATILSTAFALSSMAIMAYADNIDNSFVPDDMINENSIAPGEFTKLTGINLRMLDDISSAESLNTDQNFIPDNMINENSISPEEFTELTGIDFKMISKSDADRLRSQKSSGISLNSNVQLTWAKTKPYNNGVWDWSIIYNLDDYDVNSTYTAYATSNTYSQEALEASAHQNILMSMTPNDGKSDLVRVYVHIVDETTKAETTFDAFILASSSADCIIENPNNRNMNVVINLSNSSYSTRKGIIKMESL